MNTSYEPHPLETCKPGLLIVWENDVSVPQFDTTEDREFAISGYLGNHQDRITRIDKCEVRELGWRTPNKASISTGCKAFDKQFTGVIFGNYISNNILSLYVRGGLNTECNGKEWKPGHLLNLDLEMFQKTPEMHPVLEWVRKYQDDKKESVVLSLIRHKSGKNTTIHGAFLQTRFREFIRRFDREDMWMFRSAKSVGIMSALAPFMGLDHAINRETIFQKH